MILDGDIIDIFNRIIKENDMNQTKIADKIDISQSYLNKILRKKVKMPDEIKEKLKKRFALFLPAEQAPTD